MLGVFAEFFYETSEAGPTRRLHFGLTSNGRADLYGASCGIRVTIGHLRVTIDHHRITIGQYFFKKQT